MNDRLSFNTVGSLDQYFKQVLVTWDDQESLFIRKWIWEGLFQLGMHEIMLNPDRKISESEILKGHFAIKEVLKGVPVQYVVGEVPFYNVQLMVDENVLIPRPETEELIGKLLERFHQTNTSVLDIGTGSGCIAIALAKQNPSWTVSAVDISEKALQVARRNAVKNNVQIQFAQFDILKDAVGEERYDCIVSNPPYIPISEKQAMDPSVWKYEPNEALFTPDDDPLLFYKSIFSLAQQQVNANGWVALETHFLYSNDVEEIWKSNGQWETSIEKDLQGKDRFVFAHRKYSP
jgi:release factor glutamine methyltransferase